MLTAIPKSWFSWGYEIFQDSRSVALLDQAHMREKGEILIQERNYQIGREGLLSGAYFLRRDGENVATATKTSAFTRTFEVFTEGGLFTLASATAFKRRFVLRDGEKIIGSISPKTWISRKAVVDLPENFPLEIQVFITWLVVLMWRREQSSN
ncbi:MAG: hypothetical protein ACI8QS_001296 [Planctomycetota bacterium]|jgi:hypothetical protein